MLHDSGVFLNMIRRVDDDRKRLELLRNDTEWCIKSCTQFIGDKGWFSKCWFSKCWFVELTQTEGDYDPSKLKHRLHSGYLTSRNGNTGSSRVKRHGMHSSNLCNGMPYIDTTANELFLKLHALALTAAESSDDRNTIDITCEHDIGVFEGLKCRWDLFVSQVLGIEPSMTESSTKSAPEGQHHEHEFNENENPERRLADVTSDSVIFKGTTILFVGLIAGYLFKRCLRKPKRSTNFAADIEELIVNTEE